jgi:hypothetical protein
VLSKLLGVSHFSKVKNMKDIGMQGYVILAFDGHFDDNSRDILD